MATLRLPPFPWAHQLIIDDAADKIVNQKTSSAHLTVTRDDVLSVLESELDTVVLNDMYKWLWLVAKKSSQHVDPLHEHVFKNRTITIAENPALPLVWLYDRVYLKPIPEVLLNYSFWIKYLLPQAAQLDQTTQSKQPNQGGQSNQSNHQPQADYKIDSLSHACRTVLGFLRSYSLLIQHESDFTIAQDSKLLPRIIQYSAFEDFIGAFRFIGDEAVSKRYIYGQFRLTRLNWAVRLCRPATATRKTMLPWYYQEIRWQTGDYLRDYGAMAAFLFVMLSLTLSSLQVMLTTRTFSIWSNFIRFSWIFSVVVIILCAALVFVAVQVLPLFCSFKRSLQ
ncbi:hypothetical protein K469DRAFT_710221 [Zopfia rhizophila CBS 207.26]|uniref:Uncharacterized protein n=1 Tax=Zopfia rhizophila CBS 207.26 TaxID=1314779 RepID=A0A6A6DZM3_9PEZI|nr:hypothetical protein K469DRAFT_710221 [Zopfia rhizophila CBS 207.26]